MQHQRFRQLHLVGIMALLRRLQTQLAGDQCAVIVQRTAELKLQMRRCSGLIGSRQGPATGRVEQISFVDQDAVDPETHGLCPPTQTKADGAATHRVPFLRAVQRELQTQPLTPPGPDQQSPLCPVRTVL